MTKKEPIECIVCLSLTPIEEKDCRGCPIDKNTHYIPTVDKINDRKQVGIEISEEYYKIARHRIKKQRRVNEI